MKKHLKKFIVIGVITGVLLLMTLFDYLRAQTVNIEVVSVTPETVVADPNKPVTIHPAGDQAGTRPPPATIFPRW